MLASTHTASSPPLPHAERALVELFLFIIIPPSHEMNWLHCGVIALLVLLVFHCINRFQITVAVYRYLFLVSMSYDWETRVMYTIL